jgi:hypothetical protein
MDMVTVIISITLPTPITTIVMIIIPTLLDIEVLYQQQAIEGLKAILLFPM